MQDLLKVEKRWRRFDRKRPQGLQWLTLQFLVEQLTQQSTAIERSHQLPDALDQSWNDIVDQLRASESECEQPDCAYDAKQSLQEQWEKTDTPTGVTEEHHRVKRT